MLYKTIINLKYNRGLFYILNLLYLKLTPPKVCKEEKSWSLVIAASWSGLKLKSPLGIGDEGVPSAPVAEKKKPLKSQTKKKQ